MKSPFPFPPPRNKRPAQATGQTLQLSPPNQQFVRDLSAALQIPPSDAINVLLGYAYLSAEARRLEAMVSDGLMRIMLAKQQPENGGEPTEKAPEDPAEGTSEDALNKAREAAGMAPLGGKTTKGETDPS